MSGAVVPFSVDVPIVGRPFEVVTSLDVVVVRCLCETKNPSLTIAGINAAVECTSCHRVYFIDNIMYKRSERRMVINLGIDVSRVLGGTKQ